MKDAALQLDGRSGILASHLNFGQPERGWDFRSLGHGGVDFEEIIRTLNQIGYNGPLSVEWEDSGMNREHGAKEACEFVRKIDFQPSQVAFDAAFDK
jgi:sugar phosphate isomerase/epimerase